MTQVVKQKYALVSPDDLTPHPANPRRGDIGTITESVSANGFYGALVVQQSTGHVLAGNHRLLVAQAQGIKKVPVIYVDVTDEQAKKILTVDNAANDKADWDDRRLAELLGDIDDLQGTGFTHGDLENLMRETGMLGEAATGFLADFLADSEGDDEGDDERLEPTEADRPANIGDPAASPAAPGDQYYSLSYTLTKADRDAVNAAVKEALKRFGKSTQAEALAEICRLWHIENVGPLP